MAPSKLSPEFPLPLELLCEIIKLLPPTDLQTLSLTSRLIRSQAIHFIYGHLRYTGYISAKLRRIHRARKDVKDVIKKLELSRLSTGDEDGLVIICQFLETLSNLHVLVFSGYFQPAYLSQFISSIRHIPLLELVIETANHAPVKGFPTAGLTGLEKLSILWYPSDNWNEPRSSVAHLHALIRPTLTTLLLKPAAVTLRTFEYHLLSADDSILDTIPAILPHLTKLSIFWRRLFLWKDVHIQALSKNKNLTELRLSFDLEVNTQDTLSCDLLWFVRCYERCLKATQDIASACPQLQQCCWVIAGILEHKEYYKASHPFIVEEQMTGGNATQVVRGIKQCWMDRIWHTKGGIMNFKLEDLPGDIIDRNAVEPEYMCISRMIAFRN